MLVYMKSVNLSQCQLIYDYLISSGSNLPCFAFLIMILKMLSFVSLNHLCIPGHPFVLHVGSSVEGPGQVLPPLAGLGFVHDLDLDFVPPPHVAVQDDQPLQPVQAP